MAVTECQAKLTQVFSYGIVYLHFYEIKRSTYNTISEQDLIGTKITGIDCNLIFGKYIYIINLNVCLFVCLFEAFKLSNLCIFIHTCQMN